MTNLLTNTVSTNWVNVGSSRQNGKIQQPVVAPQQEPIPIAVQLVVR